MSSDPAISDEAREILSLGPDESDDYAYAGKVAATLQRADRLLWLPWRRKQALDLYRVVADLAAENEIEELVEEARRFLEARGIPCRPSAERIHQDYLAGLSPFDRHLSDAKLAMAEAASGIGARKRKKALQRARESYRAASRCGELGARHQKKLAALEKQLGAGSELRGRSGSKIE